MEHRCINIILYLKNNNEVKGYIITANNEREQLSILVIQIEQLCIIIRKLYYE